MTFTYDIESMIGTPKVIPLKVGDCIMKNNFGTFGRDEDSAPVIKVWSLGAMLGKKGGFSKWLVNGTYQVLPQDITILDETEAWRVMSIWTDSANVSPVVNENINTKCVREDTGKPKVTYHGKTGWQRPLFTFRMKHPDGGFQAYECPECGRVHIGKTLEHKKFELPHISVTLSEFENKELLKSVGDFLKWQKEGNSEGYPWERFEGATKILYDNYVKPLEGEGFSAWGSAYNLVSRELSRRLFYGSEEI
jgi:hypothetical protein